MMVWAIGRMPPPPMPCRARAAINAPMVGASAQATDPMMKMPTATSRTARRPWMSDNFPNSGVTAVAASR